MIIHLIAWLIKMMLNEITLYKNESIQYGPFGGDINIKFDLSNYAAKAEIGIDTSKLAANSDLAAKAEIDKWALDELIRVPVQLSKLSDVVKNDVKKTVYNKLVAKVNNIDTSGFVLKSKYDTDKSHLEKKIPDTSGLMKN